MTSTAIKRRRFSYDDTVILEAEYLRNVNWSTYKISDLANRLGFDKTKVYKWNWEKKRKDMVANR